MNFKGMTIKHAVQIAAATMGLALLALPATATHAAVFPSSPAFQNQGYFETQIVQGPDCGAVLAGMLSLRADAEYQLQGTLVVQPSGGQVLLAKRSTEITIFKPAPLTTETVVPVTGVVLPQSHVVLLSFELGNGQVLQTRLTPTSSVRVGHGAGDVQTQWGAQTIGPRPGDVAGVIIHIHLEFKGWTVDIEIKV